MNTFDKIFKHEKEETGLSFEVKEISKKIEDCKAVIDVYIQEDTNRSIAYYIAALYFFYLHLFDDYLDNRCKCARQFGISDEAGLTLVEKFVNGSLCSIIETIPDSKRANVLYLTFFRYLRSGSIAIANNFKGNFTDVEEFRVNIENGPIYRFIGELVNHLSNESLTNNMLDGFASIGEVASYADDLRDIVEDNLAGRQNIALHHISNGCTPQNTYCYITDKIKAAKLKASQLANIPVSTIEQLALCKIPTKTKFIHEITHILEKNQNQLNPLN